MSGDREVALDRQAASGPAPHLQLASGRWELLPARSSARFAVLNWGMITVHGTVPVVRGEVQLNGTVTRVHVELALDRLDTDNARRDRDLAKPSLLDLARYPTLIFDGSAPDGNNFDGNNFDGNGVEHRGVGHSGVGAGASGWTFPGTLSAHGATAAVTLSVDVEPTPDGQVVVRATTEFDRRDLGIRAPRLMIGRRISVAVSACFVLRA